MVRYMTGPRLKKTTQVRECVTSLRRAGNLTSMRGMKTLLTGRARNYALLALAALGLLLNAALATPTIDDDINASHVIGSPPYYSNHFEMYLPVYKPLTTIQLPARFLSYPWSFLYVSLLHTALIAFTAWLT